jgi:hypothetical protein
MPNLFVLDNIVCIVGSGIQSLIVECSWNVYVIQRWCHNHIAS